MESFSRWIFRCRGQGRWLGCGSVAKQLVVVVDAPSQYGMKGDGGARTELQESRQTRRIEAAMCSSVLVNETTELVPADHACRNGRGFGRVHHSWDPRIDAAMRALLVAGRHLHLQYAFGVLANDDHEPLPTLHGEQGPQDTNGTEKTRDAGNEARFSR